MTPEDKALVALMGRLKKVDAQRDALLAERKRIVSDMVASGRTLRDVGELLGLSHQAIMFIVNGRKK